MTWLQSVVPIIGVLLLFQRTTNEQKPQQYHLINGSMTWFEAQSFCRVKHTDLATVNNMADKNALVKALGGLVSHSWIGLRRGNTHRWMWSDGRGVAHFTKWGETEPNNVAGNEWCVEVSEHGTWNDIPCEEKKGFACFERRLDGMERYVFHSAHLNWVNSQEFCRSNHADMAYINTELDSSEVAEVTKKWDSKIWIGLFYDAWMWSDGGQTSFRYWLSSSLYGGDCAAVSVLQHGRWVQAQCNQKATFVCQGGLKVKRMVIRMMVRSDVSVTDATVSDALLEMLEMKLRREEVTDFNLRWRRSKNGLIFHHEPLDVIKGAGC